MSRHILLLVDTYVTEGNSPRGAKFRVHLRAFRERGLHVGLVAFMQRDYSLLDCLRHGGFIWEENEFGAPIVRDCTFYALPERRPIWRTKYDASGPMGLRSLKYYIRRHGRPDLIHAHGSQWSGVAANAVLNSLGIPYVVTEHMTNYARGVVEEAHLPTMRKVFSEARMRLPIGESTGQLLEDMFGDDFRPWRVIPNMIDDQLFPARTGRTSPTGTPFVFISVGRFDRIKGFDVLLEAFAAGFKGRPVNLRIGGGGQLESELHALCEGLGIGKQVEFLGQLSRERVSEELRRADAYVLASRHETFGIPVVEAHASGLPVVATTCGVHEKLIDDSNGIWVEPSNVSALTEGMELMLQKHADFDLDGIRARCLANYAPHAVLDQLEEIYDKALSSAGS
ncbi:glycosyltransferase [Denitrobaculum tricleocarpae]|uniref:Glycosyltransferase family 4 protein n=1 Tax=Denitrobaculum tricleocarpae TaxID=2591009 RepID=A0A545U2F3_9PROT|nr:glycosyltransferase [Denitrobaculum tricleocarpae]TQV83651.1 glycosyltransferase family 4 protein [Denitrobaculum tricleocarpae]